MRTLSAFVAALLLSTTAAHGAPRRKAHKPHTESRWVRDCITERTGPTDGVTVTEARRICRAEEPDDEVGAAKAALVLARLNAKVAKAQERMRKAAAACEQAVTDRCVELADESGATDCDTTAGLRAEFELTCLGKPAAK